MSHESVDADAIVHSPVLDQLELFFSEPSFTSAISDFAIEHAPSIQPIAGAHAARACFPDPVVSRPARRVRRG